MGYNYIIFFIVDSFTTIPAKMSLALLISTMKGAGRYSTMVPISDMSACL